jgi:hypothetical protein
MVEKVHFGGFDKDKEKEGDLENYKKTKAEIYKEIIAKSKMMKIVK